MRHQSTAVVLIAALGLAACGKKAGDAPGAPARPEGPPAAVEPAAGPVEPAPAAEPGPPPATPEAPAAPEPGASEVAAADSVPETDEAWLSYVDGAVRAVDADGSRDLAEGDALLPGTVVTVDPGGQAEIDLPDGSVVDLDEMSELLVSKVEVDGGLRAIELSLLSGAARVTAAKSEEAGSIFVLGTPVGTTEVHGTEYSVDLGDDADKAEIAVFDGKVSVQSGEETKDVEAKPDGPAVVELKPAVPIAVIEARAELRERWLAWERRQADRLIVKYGIDIRTPALIAAAALDAARHPAWKAQIALRRARVVARSMALADAAGAALDGKLTPGERFEAAAEAWRARVAPAVAIAAEVRARKLDRWAARTADRAARHASMAVRLAETRAAHAAWRAEHRAIVRGPHGVRVVVPPVVVPPGVNVPGPGPHHVLRPPVLRPRPSPARPRRP